MLPKLHLDPAVLARYRLDALASALYGVFSGIIMPFISIAALTLGAEPWHIALLTAAPFAGKILSLIGGAYIGQRSKRTIFILSCIVERICWMLTAFIVSPTYFSFLAVLLYLVEMFRVPAHISIIHAMYPTGVRGSIITRLMMVAGALGFIATLFTGYLLDSVSHRILFPIGAIFGLLSLLVFSKINVPEIDERRTPKETLRHILILCKGNKPLHKFLLFTTFIEGSQLLLAPLIPLFLVQVLTLPKKLIGVLFGIQTLATILLSPFLGHFLDRLGPIRVLRFLGIAAMLGTAFFFFGHWLILIPAFILLGCIGAGIFPSFIESQKLFVPPSRINDSSAIVATVSGIRGATLPFLAVSMSVTLGYTVTFAIIIAIAFIGTVLYSTDAHYA